MKLQSNNPRITDVELTNNLSHLSYLLDGNLVEVDGEFNFFGQNDKGEYVGLAECAVVRDEEDEVIEEIDFEAYFID